ncbi:hypothetical protein B0H11DRAFT_2260432 [Mycena galericulata]|nr:hypothetical protein B0H11DRAFT_2260432 [Mycena galericulata]
MDARRKVKKERDVTPPCSASFPPTELVCSASASPFCSSPSVFPDRPYRCQRQRSQRQIQPTELVSSPSADPFLSVPMAVNTSQSTPATSTLSVASTRSAFVPGHGPRFLPPPTLPMPNERPATFALTVKSADADSNTATSALSIAPLVSSDRQLLSPSCASTSVSPSRGPGCLFTSTAPRTALALNAHHVRQLRRPHPPSTRFPGAFFYLVTTPPTHDTNARQLCLPPMQLLPASSPSFAGTHRSANTAPLLLLRVLGVRCPVPRRRPCAMGVGAETRDDLNAAAIWSYFGSPVAVILLLLLSSSPSSPSAVRFRVTAWGCLRLSFATGRYGRSLLGPTLVHRPRHISSAD